ncbi:MAG: RtcB family protein [Puniceicoccales bacterium]|jgi:tRNA-splicing ligase RtcB|nr:RtcB family protein [Puniceicoccales bacterium]
MTHQEIIKLGVPEGKPLSLAFHLIKLMAESGADRAAMEARISAVVQDPAAFADDPQAGPFAQVLLSERYVPRAEPAPWRQWGSGLEETAVQQMRVACQLPVSFAGALMPDAHVGYGLPIGGVLATRNAVIPYAVGVDIACRMKLSVYDLPVSLLEDDENRLKSALARETQFGVGATFKQRRQHEVMDRDWGVSPITRQNKDKAWAQLGTSGSGNHFVEYGVLTLDAPALGLDAGRYLALLSHSGSRGTGASVADHYSKLAKKMHPELPDNQRNLAWLDLDTPEGQEYWAAMELMGEYAAANHACIHKHIAAQLGAQVLLDVENHHNFAWKEIHQGEEVIVHRKGATPAGADVLGIIPGSMGAPGYVVRGRGNAESLHSASHGAGRRMSRTKAFETITWEQTHAWLKERGVKLMSAGLDESPLAYKDIAEVMAAQVDLVETLARFDPRLVKMAPAGERPED